MKKTKDSLGDRIKDYEITFKQRLLKNMYTIIRLDGKAFHTYTKGFNKPFDKGLVDDMIATTKYLCENIQGVKLGYVQSDEITLVLTDFDTYSTQAWFEGEIQKIVSISASLATSYFNQIRLLRKCGDMGGDLRENMISADEIKRTTLAQFDSRVFQVPNLAEVENTLLWRQRDAIKNSISAAAYAVGTHEESQKLNGGQKQELIFQRGDLLRGKMIACGYDFPEKENFNWNDLPDHLKRGMSVFKKPMAKYFTKAIYDKDKSPKKDGWFVTPEKPDTDKFKYFKMVSTWAEEPLEFPLSNSNFKPKPIPNNI